MFADAPKEHSKFAISFRVAVTVSKPRCCSQPQRRESHCYILSRIIGKSYNIMHSRSSFDVIAQCHVTDAPVAMSHFTAVFSTLFHIHGRLTAASHRHRDVHATAISLHNLLDEANITSENLHLQWRDPDYLRMRHTCCAQEILAFKEMKEDADLDMETPAFATIVTRMLMASLYP